MAEYQTEQKKRLWDFLRHNKDAAFTIEELAIGIRAEQGKQTPGKSTLYRQINKLVEDGKVKRIVKENSRHFVYQLLDGNNCANVPILTLYIYVPTGSPTPPWLAMLWIWANT